MTDTNQLPPLPEPDDLNDRWTMSHVYTADQMRAYALQARAQVQGEPVTVAVDHFDNGPFEAYTNRIHPPVEIGTKLYTTPQPAQAITHDVWIKHPYTVALMEQVKDLSSKVATHATQPAAVPMSDEQRVVVSFPLGEGDLNGASFGDPHNPTHGGQFWWRKHLRNAFGITAQAKKEGV